MTPAIGEILLFQSAQAGKRKYHLCVQEATPAQTGWFLFINSRSGYAGDLVLTDSELPCLPQSPTGESVISCSMIVRATQRQLRLFGAQRIGSIALPVARKLYAFVEDVPTLTKSDREAVLAAIATLI